MASAAVRCLHPSPVFIGTRAGYPDCDRVPGLFRCPDCDVVFERDLARNEYDEHFDPSRDRDPDAVVPTQPF